MRIESGRCNIVENHIIFKLKPQAISTFVFIFFKEFILFTNYLPTNPQTTLLLYIYDANNT